MSALFHEILYRPLFNLLVGIYNVLPSHDLGLAIVLLTILIKVIFIPLSIKALLSQRAMARVQPKLQELQEKHKNDKQLLAQATMNLYKENKVNPFSGCLPILIQLPVIWALYRVFINGIKPEALADIYSFVANPGLLTPVGFGFLDLAVKNHILSILAGVFQAIQSYLMMKLQKNKQSGAPENPAQKMTQQMMYFFPVMIVVISWNLPAGLVLYWVTTTAFSIFEQLYIKSRYQVNE